MLRHQIGGRALSIRRGDGSATRQPAAKHAITMLDSVELNRPIIDWEPIGKINGID